MDFSAITGLLASVKTATEIVSAVKDIHDETKRQSAVIELQDAILRVQSAAIGAQIEQQSLLNKLNELEATVARYQSWETEKERYQLKDFGSGTFAYELKPESSKGEPTHLICANCYNAGKKSLLQFRFITSVKQRKFDCLGCQTEQYLGDVVQAIRQSRPTRSSDW